MLYHKLMRTKTAVILAGGSGKRMKKFDTIKPLVMIAGKPLILRVIERLQEAGVEKIYIVVGSGEQMIKRTLLGYTEVKANIVYVAQKQGAQSMLNSLQSLEKSLKESFFVTVCDHIFAKNPFKLFGEQARGKGVISVLASASGEYNNNSGAQVRVKLAGGRIADAGRSIKDYNAYEAGVYHFGKGAYAQFNTMLVRHPEISSVEQALAIYGKHRLLMPVVMPAIEWFDVNTPAIALRAELLLQAAPTIEKQRKLAPIKTKKLPVSNVYRYNQLMTFDVTVKRGLLNSLEDYEVIPYERLHSPHHLIVDRNIDALYGKKVHQKLTKLGYNVSKWLVDPGEWSKSVEVYLKLVNDILAKGIDKQSIVISLGGGVIKDLSGFIASTLYRGIGFICIPTTVLSQCDAAITPKQGINGPGGKNMLGSYHAPLKVLVDPDVLATLDKRYIADGLAECLKQSFAQDKRFNKYLSQHTGSIAGLPFLEKTIRWSIALKIDSFAKDIKEENVALVNLYGHEIAHAIEFLSGYTLGHGESVAIGMRVSAELSELLGIGPKGLADQHIKLLKKFGLPYKIPREITAEDIIKALKYHKKSHSGEVRMVIVDRLGSIWHAGSVYTVPCANNVIATAINRSYEYTE